jgi:hypothetical protein
VPIERLKCWIITKSDEFRSLLKVNRDILVATFYKDSIRFNTLEPPPKLGAMRWAGPFVYLWQGFRLWEGTRGFLSDCVKELYIKYSKTGHYPSLYDLYEHVSSVSTKGHPRQTAYQDGILSRLKGLLDGPLASTFYCSRGHLRHLVNMNVIFEILYLPASHQTFTVNYLITYLYMYKMVNETGLRHWIAIDDANIIFDASYEKRPDLGLPVIHHLLTTVRKNKINIFACTQTPHQVGASIHSNSFAKIMFPLSNGKDRESMFQSMGIYDRDQREYCNRLKLEDREVIIKFSSRYPEPFIAEIEEPDL